MFHIDMFYDLRVIFYLIFHLFSIILVVKLIYAPHLLLKYSTQL